MDIVGSIVASDDAEAVLGVALMPGDSGAVVVTRKHHVAIQNVHERTATQSWSVSPKAAIGMPCVVHERLNRADDVPLLVTCVAGKGGSGNANCVVAWKANDAEMKFVHRHELPDAVFCVCPVQHSLDSIVVFDSGSVGVLDANFQLAANDVIRRDSPPHWARLVQDQHGRVLLLLNQQADLVQLSVFAVRARDAASLDDHHHHHHNGNGNQSAANTGAAAAASVSVDWICDHKFHSSSAIVSFSFELEQRTLTLVNAACVCFVYRFSSVAALLRASTTTLERQADAAIGEPRFVHSWQVACFDLGALAATQAPATQRRAGGGSSARRKRQSLQGAVSGSIPLLNTSPVQAALVNSTSLLLIGKAKDENHCILTMWSTEYGSLLMTSIVACTVTEKGVTAPMISSSRRSLVALIDINSDQDAPDDAGADDGRVLHCAIASSRIRLADLLMTAERTSAAVVPGAERPWSGAPAVIDLASMLGVSAERKSFALTPLAGDAQFAALEQSVLKRLSAAKDEDAALRICRELLASPPTPTGTVNVSNETALRAASVCIEHRWRKPLACVVRTRALSAASCDGVLALALDGEGDEEARLDLLSACFECQGDIAGADIVRLLHFALASPPSAALLKRICNGAQATPAEATAWFVDRILAIDFDRVNLHRHVAALDAWTCERLLAHLRRRLTCLSATLGDSSLSTVRLVPAAASAAASAAAADDEQPQASLTDLLTKIAQDRAAAKLQRRAPSVLAARTLSLDTAIAWLEVLLDARSQTLARRAETLTELQRIQQLLQHEVGVCDVLAPVKGFLFEIMNTQKLLKLRAVDETPPYCIEVLRL
jgi:hypothetical protein